MNLMKKSMVKLFVCCMILTVPGCSRETEVKEIETKEAVSNMNIEKQDFGKTPDGTPVSLYTLTNANGLKAMI